MATKIRLYVKATDGNWYRKRFRIESDLPNQPATKANRLKLDGTWLEHIRIEGWDEDDDHWMAICGREQPMELVEKPGWRATDPPT